AASRPAFGPHQRHRHRRGRRLDRGQRAARRHYSGAGASAVSMKQTEPRESPPNRGDAWRAKEQSLQLGVLGFGLLVDRNVWVGVFPEGEKILICRAGFIVGGGVFGGVEGVGTSQSKPGQ